MTTTNCCDQCLMKINDGACLNPSCACHTPNPLTAAIKVKNKQRESCKQRASIEDGVVSIQCFSSRKELVGVILLDEADYLKVAGRTWYIGSDGYAVWDDREKGRKKKTLMMHRLILETPEGMFSDHVNGNRLDNRRSNLRTVTHRQNVHNSRVRKSSRTGYKGVRPERGKFYVRYLQDGRRVNLGPFETAEDAAHAYDNAIYKARGEYARLNFPRTAHRGDITNK